MARLEANRNMESSLLKQKSKQRLRRLDKEGIDAILIETHSHEDDFDHRKAREQVGASDVVALLKTKFVYCLSFFQNSSENLSQLCNDKVTHGV